MREDSIGQGDEQLLPTRLGLLRRGAFPSVAVAEVDVQLNEVWKVPQQVIPSLSGHVVDVAMAVWTMDGSMH